jgi:hypothetical protein
MLQSSSADPTFPPVTFQFMGFDYPDERSAVCGCRFPGFDVPGSGLYIHVGVLDRSVLRVLSRH